MRTYHVYILASDARELYEGITNELFKRVAQHRTSVDRQSYTTKHRIGRLVYCESIHDVLAAIRRREADQELDSKTKVGIDRNDEPGLAGSGSRRLAVELRPLAALGVTALLHSG